MEILIVRGVSIGVNAADVDMVALSPMATEVCNGVVVDTFRAFSRELEVETVGPRAANQRIAAQTSLQRIRASTPNHEVAGRRAGKHIGGARRPDDMVPRTGGLRM